MFYIIVLSICFVFSSISLVSNRKYSILMLFFSIAFIWLSAIRPSVGTDYNEYLDIWNLFSNYNSKSDMLWNYSNIEIGYKYFIYVVSFFGGKEFYFLSNAILSVGLLFLGLHRIRNYFYLSYPIIILVFFCCFYVPYTFNAMRQGIVMAILVFSLKDIIEKRIFRISLYSLLALSIHSTGLLIFLSYFVFNRKFNCFTFLIVGTIVSSLILNLNIVSVVANVISPGKYAFFYQSWGDTGLTSFLLRVLIVAFLMFNISTCDKNDYYCRLLCVYLMGFFFYILFFNVGMMAGRLNMFYRVLELVLFSHVLLSSSGNRRIFNYIFILAVSFSQLYVTAGNPDNYWEMSLIL